LRLPGDKSITHRALLLAAMAQGRSHIVHGSGALDPRSTASCLRSLGVHVDATPTHGGNLDWTVESDGWTRWSDPSGVLDCGNSGTTLRLLAGALAGREGYAVLDGDASLRGRPVARIIGPLRSMGATLHARASDSLPPVTVVGTRPLRAAEHRLPVPSAQVKSAILLAGLAADGSTTVREPVATRDHTERMLRRRGVPVRTEADGRDANVVTVEGPNSPSARDERIPGDVSAAAFWLVAGSIHPDAELVLENVGTNPTRRRAIDLLRAMGARIEESEGGSDADAEPVATLTVRSADLRGIELTSRDVAEAIDEIPALCLAASGARGTTTIRGAGELRRKESDRIAGIADGLRALGGDVRVDGDDITIHGRPAGLRGATVQTHGDHRLAMTFAVAGLVASGTTTVADADSAAVSYPTFFSDLEGVRA
jgi:3-phosphoshikimate 1-carboxyvinyltransferase